jgi:hypothetical protein
LQVSAQHLSGLSHPTQLIAPFFKKAVGETMRSLFSALSLILLLAFISRCASSVSQEAIFCNPPQADIYWGKTEASLERTGLKTPNCRSISAPKLESWCYQVKKKGYHDSEIICRGEEGFRYLDFHLIPIKAVITSEPPGAIIYLGARKDRLEQTGFRTPRIFAVEDLPTDSGADREGSYFQVKMEGYHDSEVIFLPRQQQDREIHFKLTPAKP